MPNARTAALVATLLALAPAPAAAQCDAPTLLVILDKSSSMITGDVPSGTTKWEAARRAVESITIRFEDRIDFGLLVFPDPDACRVDGVAVDAGPHRAAAIAAHLAVPPPPTGHWTPMARALDVAAEYPPLWEADRRRLAVLVTDGWQWCSPYDPDTRFEPVEHAAALLATGTALYVVGFGGGVDARTLNRLAWDAGTHLPGCDPEGDDPAAPDPCYRRAEDTTELESILDAIARRATEEICDGIDNDCDGAIDDDLFRPCATTCGAGLETCERGVWRACSARTPRAEACDGITDDDCDGTVDEGCACVDRELRLCGADVGACRPGRQVCVGGAWTSCIGEVGPTEEDCDGVDDDCDGATDDDAPCPPGEVCLAAACVPAPPPLEVPDDPEDDEATLGCACAVPGGSGPPAASLLLLAALAPLPVLRARLRRSRPRP